ncbi:MAG: NAD-dependent succinate-semialdehyde dehydrogenase [Flavobacteriaceae bacterium]|nr:NAD-dependent succinate-semialdehyde dehydrogenase [Flavobacteriaceae bacterium]
MKSINPYNGEIVFENKKHTQKEVEKIIENAHQAFLDWRFSSFEEREAKMKKLGEILIKNKEKYAEVMALEMGKPIAQGISEIEKCAWLCNYYAENALEQLKDKKIKTEASSSYVKYEPLGVILAIMPWNYPFWQVFRFAVPTLMAGNTTLLKHASNVMQSAKIMEEIFSQAEFPKNTFNTLFIGSDKVEKIIRNPRVKGVSLTGSKAAGAAVASIAAEEIKPSLLELGGSNALVVFADCDMENTLQTVINARFQNTGQSCIAGKRLVIEESIAEEFISKLIKKTIELKSGDPTELSTFIGTMVNKEAAKHLHDQLQKSLKMGAKLLIGGNYNDAYFEPTIVSDVHQKMPVFHEETFGPLLACTTFKTVEEAADLANATEFGLGVSLFTQNQKWVEKMIPILQDGAVFVNELVKSDPRLPFGGTKTSGYGRELSQDGIMAFVNKKTVYVK